MRFLLARLLTRPKPPVSHARQEMDARTLTRPVSSVRVIKGAPAPLARPGADDQPKERS